MTTSPTDDTLIAASRRDPEAFGLLYDRHATVIHAFLARRAGYDTAADLLSEVFVAALGSRHTFQAHDSGSALPWLYGIGRNVLRTHLRLRRGLPLLDDASVVDWEAVDARLDASSQSQQLHMMLASLSEIEKEILILVAWDQLSVTEAAEVLGISATAARSRLHRARAHAAEFITATEGELA